MLSGWLKRGLWLLLTTAMFTVLFVHLYYTVTRYLARPVSIRTEVSGM